MRSSTRALAAADGQRYQIEPMSGRRRRRGRRRMIPGFNHNIKHKGRMFHVQTEDSGPRNPHIITHLFVGGNILSSKKTQYAELLGQSGWETTVRKMMEEQHKQMLRNLVHGAFDSVDVGTAYHLDGPAPLNLATSSSATAASAVPGSAAGHPGTLPAAASGPDQAASSGEAASAETLAAARVADGPVRGVFGEDLISEKSLDEVILGYLAEDLADVD
jgi:hypothetical protein